MLGWLSKKAERWARPADDAAHALYAAIAAGARNPALYTGYGIADTPDGRFDTLTLLAVLVIRRLRDAAGNGHAHALAQGITDTMFADLDLSLHEMGVSDTKVGRRVKVMARAYLGRQKAYTHALDTADRAALAAALNRNLYRGDGDMESGGDASCHAPALAEAVMAAAGVLAGLPDDRLTPEAVAAVLAGICGSSLAETPETR